MGYRLENIIYRRKVRSDGDYEKIFWRFENFKFF